MFSFFANLTLNRFNLQVLLRKNLFQIFLLLVLYQYLVLKDWVDTDQWLSVEIMVFLFALVLHCYVV